MKEQFGEKLGLQDSPGMFLLWTLDRCERRVKGFVGSVGTCSSRGLLVWYLESVIYSG